MRKPLWIVPALAAFTLGGSVQAATPLLRLYSGTTAQSASILLGGWGSGYAKDSKEEAFTGSQSILVATGGYYSGGRIDFTSPVDMSTYAGQSAPALRLDVKFASAGAGVNSATGGAAIPGGGERIAQVPGMPGPPGGPGAPGGYQPPAYQPGMVADDAPRTPAVDNMRVLLFSGSTRVAAVDQPVDAGLGDNGWIPVTIPLSAFKNSAGASPNWSGFRMNRMVIFGDTSDTLYIGAISIVNNDIAITDVSAGEEQTVAQYDPVSFKGTGQGPAGLHYSWDFNATDGIQEDAIGRDATFRYRKAGIYTVTLTVSDPTGVSKPVTATTKIEVTG